MNSRLTTWLDYVRVKLSVRTISHSQFVAVSVLGCILLSAGSGCANKTGHLQRSIDRSAAKMSFVSWNLRAMVSAPRESAQSRGFKIASLSNRELYRLMETRPAPDLATIAGKWNGINKGVGSAMMGLMQDVKVLEGEDCVSGYNILVKQVSISDLPCRGWRPELDPKTCKPKTMGNFIAVAPNCCGKLGHTVKLDYTIAENPWFDPSRFLIDELVAIDDDILLGRATANIGKLHVPVAYFVLTRAPQPECPHAEVDKPSNVSDTQYSVLDPTPIRETVNREILAEPSNPLGDASSTSRAEPNTDKVQEQLDTETSASDKAVVTSARETLVNE